MRVQKADRSGSLNLISGDDGVGKSGDGVEMARFYPFLPGIGRFKINPIVA